MDILQPLPIEEWSLLQDSLKRDWPTYSYYYYFVNNSIKWKKKDPQFELQIYCPNGDVNSGAFVGIQTHSWAVVYLFAFNESKELLNLILRETSLINWNEFVMFPSVHPHFNGILEDFIEKHSDSKNIVLEGKDVTYNYFKPKEECLQLEILVPDECEIRNLDESHIPIVHSVWPHRSETEPKKTTEFLASMVRLNRGVGLFLKKDGSLVSWIIHFDWGGLGMLQTLEEHKRKGYGRIVVKAIIKQLAEEENLDSFAFIIDKNIASQKLFESLGYERLQATTFYCTLPKSK